MLCNICHKEEAIIHFESISNGKVIKLDLCEKCAKKKGVEIKPPFSLTELLSTLTDFEVLPSIAAKEKKIIECPTCGLTYSEFKRDGKLGCGNCYTTFSNQIIPLLEKIHGSSKYLGKTRGVKIAKSEEIVNLRRQLEEALKKEEYEKAAEIRDKLKELEKK